jgi:FMN phosphatase YigB (HAD superfamily)
VAIGEEIGVSKPLAQAFHSAVERFGVAHGEALIVGDSPELDYDGALAAGLRALLLDRDDAHGAGGRQRIRTLRSVWPG